MTSRTPSMQRVRAPAGEQETPEVLQLAAEVETTVHLQAQEARDRAEAARHRMTYEQYRAMPDHIKAVLSYEGAPSVGQTPFQNLPISAVLAGDPDAVGQHGALSTEAFERLTQDVPEYDAKTHVLMWRRPVEMVFPDGRFRLAHPDLQAVPRKEAPRKYLEGWRYTPEAELPPVPTLPCLIVSSGRGCEYRGVVPDEVEAHMRYWHPDETETLERRRQRAAEDRRAAEESRRADAMEKLLAHIAAGGQLPAMPGTEG